MATTKTFKTSLAAFIDDLKEIAAETASSPANADVEMFVLAGRAADTLAKLQQKLKAYEEVDIQSFITAKKADYDAHRATEKAKRIAKGDEE